MAPPALTSPAPLAPASPTPAQEEAARTTTCANTDNTVEHYAQALACTALIKTDPNNVEALSARGAVYAAVGELDRAIEDFSSVIALTPQSAEALYARGDTLRRANRPDDALADLTKAIALDPRSARAYAARGAVQLEQNHFANARTDLDKALALNPAYAFALEQRLLLGMKTGNFRLALEDADALAGLAPEQADYQNMRCWTRVVSRSQLDVARKACDRAIAMSGGAASYFDSRGLLNLKEGKYAAALADYDAALAKAAEIKGDRADSLLGRGLALRGLKRTAEAREAVQSALAKDPGVGDMFRRYGYAP
jgi:tetratricopeptide (TPR) repeat protein